MVASPRLCSLEVAGVAVELVLIFMTEVPAEVEALLDD